MKIAVLPGDGIGPEVTAQAVKVLNAMQGDGLKFEMEEAPIGGAGYDAAGDPLPEATLRLAQAADAVLLGAVAAINTISCRVRCVRNKACCAFARN